MTLYSSFAARGANAWWRYALATPFALVLAVVLTVAIVIGLQLAHLFPNDFAQRVQDASRPLSFYTLNGMVFLVMLMAFVIAIAVVHRKSFADVVGAWTWRGFCVGFAVWAAVLVVAAVLDFAISPSGFHISANGQTALLALAASGGLAVQTFAEEFVFRGYLTQGLLLATRRTMPTALISGALFGALHIPNGAPQAVNATLFGVVLAIIAIRTGGIAFTYGLHLANNLFGAFVLVSSGDAFRGSPGLFTQNTPHLMWWDTGVGAVALLVLGWVVYRRTPGAAGN